jgi:hypothetical protein
LGGVEYSGDGISKTILRFLPDLKIPINSSAGPPVREVSLVPSILGPQWLIEVVLTFAKPAF